MEENPIDIFEYFVGLDSLGKLINVFKTENIN